MPTSEQSPPQPLTKLSGLYAITDPNFTPSETLLAQVEAALSGGARIIQYRDKIQPGLTLKAAKHNQVQQEQQALHLKELIQDFQATLIINDNIELCQRVQADGIHLGQNDTSIPEARKLLGKHSIIGATCHGSIELARKALDEGADYLAFGRFFPSRTKPDAPLAQLNALHDFILQCPVPCVAIGGITLNNAAPLVRAGFSMLAVVEDVFSHPNIKYQCQQYHQLFQ